MEREYIFTTARAKELYDEFCAIPGNPVGFTAPQGYVIDEHMMEVFIAASYKCDKIALAPWELTLNLAPFMPHFLEIEYKNL